jgi:hypothetical protein
MHRVAVDGSHARWWHGVLVLSVLVAVWGPGNSVGAAGFDHGVEGSGGSHVFVAPGQEPGGRDEHRCGHHRVDPAATQATSVRLLQSGAVTGSAATTLGGDPQPAAAAVSPRAPPGSRSSVMVCVWRQ